MKNKFRQNIVIGVIAIVGTMGYNLSINQENENVRLITGNIEALAEEGIGARKYFYPLTNTFDCFHGKYDPSLTPVALHISKRVLTLPLYADLALEDVDRICEIIIKCKR